jgi:hypothetical protein
VLVQAVEDAVVCTHVHPLGIEGAVVQAAAVAWLSNVTLAAPAAHTQRRQTQPPAQPQQPPVQVDGAAAAAAAATDGEKKEGASTAAEDGQLVLQPHEVVPRLLHHLQEFTSSSDMQERLATLQAAAEAPAMVQWQAQQWQEWAAAGGMWGTPVHVQSLGSFFKGYLHSSAWDQELSLALSLTPPNFNGFQVRRGCWPGEAEAGGRQNILCWVGSAVCWSQQSHTTWAQCGSCSGRLCSFQIHMMTAQRAVHLSRACAPVPPLDPTPSVHACTPHVQIRATDAVATSLCALLHHGCGPEPARAVVSCIHYGGDTDTTAAMTGALVSSS